MKQATAGPPAVTSEEAAHTARQAGSTAGEIGTPAPTGDEDADTTRRTVSTASEVGTLAVTGNEAADQLLNSDPLALLVGMLLDQQIPLEWAFMGPYRLVERLGTELDAAQIAQWNPDDFAALVATRPALHRFPNSMAKRIQALCHHVADNYPGDAGALWTGAESGEELFGRLRDLPGYGDEKARIMIAVLAKRFEVRPSGWKVQAGAFADCEPRSVADIDSPEALQRVRAWKKEQKARGRRKDE